jgi:hypothetical protein
MFWRCRRWNWLLQHTLWGCTCGNTELYNTWIVVRGQLVTCKRTGRKWVQSETCAWRRSSARAALCLKMERFSPANLLAPKYRSMVKLVSWYYVLLCFCLTCVGIIAGGIIPRNRGRHNLSAGEKIAAVVWNPKVHYRLTKARHVDPNMKQFNPLKPSGKFTYHQF